MGAKLDKITSTIIAKIDALPLPAAVKVVIGKFKKWAVVVIDKTGILKVFQRNPRTNPAPSTSIGERVVTPASPQESTSTAAVVVPPRPTLPADLPEVKELTDQQKQRLYQWRDEALVPLIKESRGKAVDIMIAAAENGSREVSFRDVDEMGMTPPVLNEMAWLTKVDFSNCRLSEISPNLSELPYLTELNLSGNPYVVANWEPTPNSLQYLETLDLSRCGLGVTPGWIQTLPSVTHLSLRNNYLDNIGNIPPTVEVLNLESNQIQQIPETLLNGHSGSLLVILDYNPCGQEEINQQIHGRSGVHAGQGRPDEIRQPGVTLANSGRIQRVQGATGIWGEPLWDFDTTIQHWYRLAGKTDPQKLQELKDNLNLDHSQQDVIAANLCKLMISADYQNPNTWHRQADRVIALLEDMGNSREVFNPCMAILYNGTETCDDRTTLIFSEAEMTARAVKAKQQGVKSW